MLCLRGLIHNMFPDVKIQLLLFGLVSSTALLAVNNTAACT